MTRPNTRALSISLAAAALTAAVAVALYDGRKDEPVSRDRTVPFPLPRAPFPDSVSPADFVGAETCASCHMQQYGAWSRSTHGRAGGPPGRDQIIATFNGVPIRFKDAVVIPAMSAQGVYTFTVRQTGVAERVLRVDGVVGRGHLVGGGSQGFFSRYPDGTLRFLPFDFMRREGVWFCNTTSAKAGAWTPITPDMSITECVNWTPRRALGDLFRMETCSGCHGSQIQLGFDTTAKQYVTRATSLKINCESCHGPGREHVERARAGAVATSADIAMRPLATLGRDQSMAVCLQCHSLRNLLQPGYLPGKRFEEHYSLKLPLLSDKAFFPDGRTRKFAYQEGQLSSDCTRNGSLTCTDCHDPHSQTYRDINGKPLTGRLDNGQCVSCHASKAEPIELHTRHRAGSPGSQCVSCHMPYLQEPLLGNALRFARSDHTIPIPRPEYDNGLGIQNACSQCHTDRPVAALEAQIAEWYGELKPQPSYVRSLGRAMGTRDPREIADLALMPEGLHPMAQFTGLDLFFETQLAPDMPALEPEVLGRLKRLADNPDPDVRALALASLHLARGQDPEVRLFLADRLAQLGADDGIVRKRWALALGFRGDLYGRRGRHQDALTSYAKALEIRPKDPALFLQMGIASMNAGDLASGMAYVERSISIDGTESTAFVVKGLILDRQGDSDGAARAYRRATEVNPHQALSHLYLGNVLLRKNQAADAIKAYERAVALDPGLAIASFYLARSYMLAGDYSSALRAVRHGLAFAPNDSSGRATLGYLERTLSGKSPGSRD